MGCDDPGAGRAILHGGTGHRPRQADHAREAKKADYILFYKPNIPLAVVEAKDNNHSAAGGMQQAIDYAEILDVPFAYRSNVDAFLEHDRLATAGLVESELALDQFPSPRLPLAGGIERERASTRARPRRQPGVATTTAPGKCPVLSAGRDQPDVEAIARGENGILLVAAT